MGNRKNMYQVTSKYAKRASSLCAGCVSIYWGATPFPLLKSDCRRCMDTTLPSQSWLAISVRKKNSSPLNQDCKAYLRRIVNGSKNDVTSPRLLEENALNMTSLSPLRAISGWDSCDSHAVQLHQDKLGR